MFKAEERITSLAPFCSPIHSHFINGLTKESILQSLTSEWINANGTNSKTTYNNFYY